MFSYYGNTNIFSPRGYLETAFRLFTFSMVLFHVLNFCFFRPILNINNTNMESLIFSILCSVLYGGILALNFQCVVETITVTDADRFMNTINLVLPQMAYYPETKFDNCTTFKASLKDRLLLSRITIQMDKNIATIIGPKVTVNRLRRQVTQERSF